MLQWTEVLIAAGSAIVVAVIIRLVRARKAGAIGGPSTSTSH